ncbi:hypothetical protein IFM89_026295 [Coptis chinensis]|uniref:RRM domain-containing protein n=1 Tax=Coptis chinensis TaxID=261450 RepID=A0A835IV57_9MAGN|nr:hypothetical protein IFM89_026295 [Coptis chinensis]
MGYENQAQPSSAILIVPESTHCPKSSDKLVSKVLKLNTLSRQLKLENKKKKKMMGFKHFLKPSTPCSHHLFPSLITPNKPQNPNSNALFPQGRNVGVLVSAVKKQKRGSKNLLELAAFNELDDDEEDEEDGEEEGMFIPLSGMSEWFENKPSGFGVGKEYDTSIEEKLFEELEQSRKAQAANIAKLKSNPSLAGSKKEKQVTKASESVPSGFRVRIGNLPRKKNIQRDLKLVFKEFTAKINISPAVSGSKKTRDPICKGFAFVNLESLEAANRFVQTYSGRCITFGKVEKQITCEITNPPKSSDLSEHSADDIHASAPEQLLTSTPEQLLPSMEPHSYADSDLVDISLDSGDVSSSVDTDGQVNESISATSQAIEEGVAHITLSEMNDNENAGPKAADKIDPLPVKQQQKKPTIKKKPTVKGRSHKSPKSNIPGSAKRLKVKEKAVLADVFSKYGEKVSLALTKER